jgi:hypothetical protein
VSFTLREALRMPVFWGLRCSGRMVASDVQRSRFPPALPTLATLRAEWLSNIRGDLLAGRRRGARAGARFEIGLSGDRYRERLNFGAQKKARAWRPGRSALWSSVASLNIDS